MSSSISLPSPKNWSTTFISFEGYLRECESLEITGVLTAEINILKRKCIFPTLEFVVISLEPDTVNAILERVVNDESLASAMVHVEIANDGQIEFGAYDYFEPTYCGPAVPRSLLDGLLQSGVLLSIIPAE